MKIDEGTPAGVNNERDDLVHQKEDAGIREAETGKVDEEDVAGNEGRETWEVDEEDVAGNEGRETEKVDDEEVVEGEIPAVVEGETPAEVNADEKVEEVVSEDDGEDARTAQAVDVNVEEPESKGFKDIVVLEDGPDGEETPVDERMTRRNTRRGKQVDELVVITRARKLQFGISEGEEEKGEEIPKAQETPEKEE